MTHDIDGSGDVERAFARFITAFNRMDLLELADVFAADVTLFAPAGPSTLIVGRADVISHFERVFAAEPAGGPNVRPIDRHTRMLSADAALVTFEFARAAGSVGRRTLVFTRVGSDWKVTHIHASNT